MNKFRLGISMMLVLLIASWETDIKAQDGTVVFDQEITWEWPTSGNDYGGYGFYWWHRIEGVTNINYGNMSSTDWTSPDNYYDGEFVLRFEVLDQPTSEDFYIQFGIWQDKNKGTAHPETVASRKYVEGGTGASFQESLGSPSTWWNKEPGDPVDFSRPEDFYRIGIVLWNADPLCIPKGDDWGGGCPELEGNFFPMRARVTVTAFPSGTVAKHSVNFTVKDQDANPLGSANVSIAGGNYTTDGNGFASIELVDGTYNYTISKAGYRSSSGSVTVSGSNVSRNVTLTKHYQVTFNVKDDENQNVEGASVAIDGKNLSTNSDGNASLYLIEGSYDYTISKSGYEDETGTVNVAGDNINESVILNSVTYSLTFNVEDESSVAIQGANISINGSTITTDASGNASINLSDGDYSYTVSKDGYGGYSGSVNISGANKTENVTLSESAYSVSFNVSMAGSGDNVEGANISINGTDLTTDASGNASISLPNGDYPYTVTKSGYQEETGTVNVSGSNITEDVIMNQITWSLTFSVTDENTDAIEGATVSVNGTTITTDASGDASINVPDGDYPYTVTKDGYGNASGTVNISGANFTENVVLNTTKYTLTFSVQNENEDPVEGASIEVNQTTLTTDAAGQASIDVVNGSYDYTITHGEYDTVTGTAEIAGTDQTEVITLPEITYTVTFMVKDENDDPVENADVSIDGNNLTTDASGEVSIDLAADTYSYSVSKEGFDEGSGTVTVADQAVTEDVTLMETRYTVYFDVTDNNDESVEGANVVIDGQAVTTDVNGDASVDLVNGTYNYTVTKDGYEQVFGSITVEGAELTENVTISLTLYMLTFIVTDPEENAIEGASISINDSSLTTDSNGEATIELVNGEYPYTVSMENFKDTSSTLTISGADLTVDVTMDIIGSVDFNNSQSISIFPNPGSGMLTVESTNPFSADTEFSLYTITGEKVFSAVEKSGSNRMTLNLTEVPDGVYFLNIKTKDEIIIERIVIQK